MNKLIEILKQTGIPFAYSYFEETQDIPFIVYSFTQSSNTNADNVVYANTNTYTIELYTNKKDDNDKTKIIDEDEKKLEQILNDNEICWNKVETFIDDENIFQITYYVDILEC